MIATLLECAALPGSPLELLDQKMGWGISFSSIELNELKNYLKVVQPLHSMFDKLNAEKDSNIQKVIPSLKVTKINKLFVQ